MKCRDCGQDGFKSIGEVNHHKATDCPMRVEDDELAKASSDKLIIPWSLCDPTLKVLSTGTPMPFVVLGIITPDGVEVKELKMSRSGRGLY